jgi:hypothetical protein
MAKEPNANGWVKVRIETRIELAAGYFEPDVHLNVNGENPCGE